MSKLRILPVIGLGLALCLTQSKFVEAADKQYISFDVPGALITTGVSINSKGTIVGYFVDAAYVSHSFVRLPNGSIFAAEPSGAKSSTFYGINDQGTAVGQYEDVLGGTIYGFLRYADGSIKVINPPVPSLGIQPFGINSEGAVTGGYNGHSFIRYTDGRFITFDPPNSLNSEAAAINALNTVTGVYFDKNVVQHSYIRYSDGRMSVFDAPGTSTDDPQPTAINICGSVIGNYNGGHDNEQHSFLRTPDGKVTEIPVPGAAITGAFSINNRGSITGYYFGSIGPEKGFLRNPDGTFLEFIVPNSEETAPQAMNSSGAITGGYTDTSGNHGFLRLP